MEKYAGSASLEILWNGFLGRRYFFCKIDIFNINQKSKYKNSRKMIISISSRLFLGQSTQYNDSQPDNNSASKIATTRYSYIVFGMLGNIVIVGLLISSSKFIHVH